MARSLLQETDSLLTCTERADRGRAEAAADSLYRHPGLRTPRFSWVESPHEGLKLLRRDLGDGHWQEESLFEVVNPSSRYGDTLEAVIRDNTSPGVSEALEDVWRELKPDYPGLSLPGANDTATRAQLMALSSRENCFLGGYEAYRLVMHTFARNCLRLLYPPSLARHLDLLDEISRLSGWWWPQRELAVMCERPIEIYRAGNGLSVHREDGPLVKYEDGWGGATGSRRDCS